MEKKVQFFKECPVCRKKLDGQEDTCPHCGFDGLDTLFLSQEDYLNWQETVLNPYKEMIKPPRIFAGYPGVLILMSNGDLYGYGNNDTGAFGEENYGSKLTKPQLVAKNVKSAALGYNYSIYLTKEGKVELLGRSNIPFRERFGEIPDVDEVYAAGYKDVFWVKYKNGEFGVWGTNTDGWITEATKLLLREYERIVVERDMYYRSRKRTIGHGIGNIGGYIWIDAPSKHDSWISPNMQEFKREIQETNEFRMYAEKYSAANIIFISNKEKDMGEEEEKIYTEEDDWNVRITTSKAKKALYKMYIYFINNYLYYPTAIKKDACYEPDLVKSGSGLIECDALDRWGWLNGLKIEYFRYHSLEYIARLSEDGKLEVMRYGQTGDVYAIYEEVTDVSVSESQAYILTKDKILYCLSLPDFINAKKLSEAERIDY